MVIIFKATVGFEIVSTSSEAKARKNPSQFQFWLPRRPREQRKGLCLVDQMRRIAQPEGASVAQMARSITSVLLGASKLPPRGWPIQHRPILGASKPGYTWGSCVLLLSAVNSAQLSSTLMASSVSSSWEKIKEKHDESGL